MAAPTMTGMQGARLAWGAILLTSPGPVASCIGVRRAGPGFRGVIRLLGVRELVQGALGWSRATPSLLAVGVGVDAIHASSMLLIAALSRTWRRSALLSAATATIFAVWGAWQANAVASDGQVRTTP